MSKYARVTFVCEVCGKEKAVSPSYAKKNPRYCSTDCFSKRVIPIETREKQSKAKKGKVTWNKGVAMWDTREHPRGTLGKHPKRVSITEETRQKLSESHKGIKYPEHTGENHWNWHGGVSTESETIRNSPEAKEWRRQVYKRDNYTCQLCGQRGGKLHADHIIPFSVDKAKRFDIKNGRTLCVDCHRKTETYGAGSINYGKNHLDKLNPQTI